MSVVQSLSGDQWTMTRRCGVIAKHWSQLWAAVQLLVLREKGGADLVIFKEQILRRHQRAHFLDGVRKLGISMDLPPAVIAAQYHYLSNQMGGLPMEYIEESPKKAWIRYLAPSWGFPGAALFAVPAAAHRAMFSGWHPYNGGSLNCPRLGFVLTKVYHDGEPYDEGYFQEYDHDLMPDERIQFKPVTSSPDFYPDRAPKLDPAKWTVDRLARANRNFARGYVEDGVRTLLSMYGLHVGASYLAHGARLCAVQYFLELRDTLGITGNKAADFVRLFAHLGELAGENISVTKIGEGSYALRRVGRIFDAGDAPREVYEALFEYVKTAAKIINPRLRVAMKSLTLGNSAVEEWVVDDVKDRLF